MWVRVVIVHLGPILANVPVNNPFVPIDQVTKPPHPTQSPIDGHIQSDRSVGLGAMTICMVPT